MRLLACGCTVSCESSFLSFCPFIAVIIKSFQYTYERICSSLQWRTLTYVRWLVLWICLSFYRYHATAGMLTYLADELRAIDHDRPPERAVRKTLFSFHLWRPARYRRPGCAPGPSPPVADPEVNKLSRRSADLSMSIGWLNVQSLNNKTDAVSDVIVDRSLDVLALTETWHVTSNDLCLHRAAPHGYAVTDVPRSAGRGGGVAVIYRKHLKCSRIALPLVTTFEAICTRLSTDNGPVVLLNVYRPSSARVSSQFFDELASVLELLVLHSCPVIIGGDFNVHAHARRH